MVLIEPIIVFLIQYKKLNSLIIKYFYIFKKIIILAQSNTVSEIGIGYKPVLNDKVEFFEYPTYKGIINSIYLFIKMIIIAKRVVKKANFWILHSPSLESTAILPWLLYYNIPYALVLRGYQSFNTTY